MKNTVNNDTQDAQPKQSHGKVWLVGAGPGDPELLTMRAHRVIQSADVVLYDHLISQAVIDLIPATAQDFFVGKPFGCKQRVAQSHIHALMIRFAKEHKAVVRLKSGDPLIFGRGGEEMAALQQAGIEFEVVPGITAASACASAAKISLTHRDYAQTLSLCTGHTREGSTAIDAVHQHQKTYVFYMGIHNVEAICEHLMSNEQQPGSRAACIVENGSQRNQRIFSTTLAQLAHTVKVQGVCSPALLIVGDVTQSAQSSQLSQGYTHNFSLGATPQEAAQ